MSHPIACSDRRGQAYDMCRTALIRRSDEFGSLMVPQTVRRGAGAQLEALDPVQ